jgi:hypothetical protein
MAASLRRLLRRLAILRERPCSSPGESLAQPLLVGAWRKKRPNPLHDVRHGRAHRQLRAAVKTQVLAGVRSALAEVSRSGLTTRGSARVARDT